MRSLRVGQIVPSSNVTMETEIPAMLRMRESILPERFTFHSARMRMKKVTKEELAAMDADSDRCALELSDAAVDVLGYACLVAIMAMGPGYHRESQTKLAQVARAEGAHAAVISSAGALIATLQELGLGKVAILAPYMKPLTQTVVEAEGIEVCAAHALEISDNLAVGRRPPELALNAAAEIDLTGAQALVLSACVQMPAAAAIEAAEQKFGLPVVTASSCTVRQMLKALSVVPIVSGFGAALSSQNA